MKHWIILFVFLFVLTSSVSGREPMPAQVKVATAEAGMASNTSDMTGTLYFDRTSRVSPEVAARITSVTFREGDRIRKGDVLARLDSRILEKEIALEKARMAAIEVRIAHTKLNLERLTQLRKNNTVTEASFDEARFSYDELTQERIAIARQVDILEIRKAKHLITAPFDGIILEKHAERGEWVVPGSPICLLGDLDALYVQVPMAERLIGYSKAGDRLPVSLNAFEKEITGIVKGIRPQADPRTKNVSLKIKVDYTGPVAENMSARVQVPVSIQQPMVMMPRDALVQVRGTDTVYTIKEGKAVGIPVKKIYSGADRIGVLPNGLSGGMTVVVEGNERLAPNQPVMVQGE